MRTLVLLIVLSFGTMALHAQVICQPTSSEGSGYLAVTFAGLSHENPDCQHPDFGAHITQDFDQDLQRNVFVFHSHITDDSDRCMKQDRVRIEIKGGPNTHTTLQHPEGSKSYYRWKFQLPEDFKGTNTFCHIFQNKAYGGEDTGYPILTLTVRADRIEIIQNGGDSGTSIGVLKTANLDLFLGKWVEVYVEQNHGNHGTLLFEIKDMASGDLILQYENNDIDLWREGANFNRPKFGIYRKKQSSLKDEKIRFSDFCISEMESLQCPSEAGMIIGTEDLNSSNAIQVFPNPAKEQICFKLKETPKAIAKIFAIDGRQIGKSHNLQDETCVKTSNLKTGHYYMQITLPNHRILYHQFIVQ